MSPTRLVWTWAPPLSGCPCHAEGWGGVRVACFASTQDVALRPLRLDARRLADSQTRGLAERASAADLDRSRRRTTTLRRGRLILRRSDAAPPMDRAFQKSLHTVHPMNRMIIKPIPSALDLRLDDDEKTPHNVNVVLLCLFCKTMLKASHSKREEKEEEAWRSRPVRDVRPFLRSSTISSCGKLGQVRGSSWELVGCPLAAQRRFTAVVRLCARRISSRWVKTRESTS